MTPVRRPPATRAAWLAIVLLPLILLAIPDASALARIQEPRDSSAPATSEETDADRAELDGFEALMRRGELGQRISRDLDEYLADFPRSGRARALRVELRRRKGRYEDAEEDLAAAAAPLGDVPSRVALATAAFDLHFERGRIDQCEQDLALGIADGADGDRAFAPLWSRRVVLLAASGRRKEAYAEYARRFKDSTREVEDAPYVLELGRSLLALQDIRRAAEALSPLEKTWRDARDVRQGEALLLLGRAYRLGHDGGDAITAVDALGDALKIDASSVPAHVELARTRIFRMDSDKAEESIREALGVNPRSPDAWSARAEILLLDQRASEGLEAAENALRENPRHGAALATKIAALGILGKMEDAQKVYAELVAAEPDRGENFCRVADIQNYLYRFREAIPNYRRAIHVDPGFTQSYVGLARCLVNTGDLAGAIEMLKEFRRRDDVPHVLADNTTKALRTLAGFVEVRRGTFTYLMHAVETPVLVPLLDQLYGKVWPDLCARYGFDPATPVRIECFPKHDDFSARTVGFTGFGALGVCFGNVFTLLSPRSELRGQFAFDKTAVHELVHVVTLGLSRNKVPRWLTEGISVHEEHVYASSADREMDLELFNYFKSGEIVPVRELNRLFGGPKIMFGYYQGGLLADYLVEQRGERVLTEMLERYARDEETPQVVQAVLGISCEELDRAFLEWLDRTRISKMKVQPTYTDLGRSRLRERLQSTPAGQQPDAELLAQLAWAYHRAGRTVDRDDFLNRALRADPRRPSARFLMAERALGARKRDVAKAEFEAGFEAGGEEFFALLRYVELLATEASVFAEGPGGVPEGHPSVHGGAEAGGEAAQPQLAEGDRALRERLLDLLERAKRCFPRYVAENTPYVLRARLLRQLGREQEALDELRAFCAIHESDEQARQILARDALDRQDWAEAKRWLLELRMLDPFVRAVWRDLARCEKALGAPAAAIELLELALVIDPSTERDYDPARASRNVPEGSSEVDPEARARAELLLDLAELRLDVGEKEAADRALEEARGLAPDPQRLEALTRRLTREGS